MSCFARTERRTLHVNNDKCGVLGRDLHSTSKVGNIRSEYSKKSVYYELCTSLDTFGGGTVSFPAGEIKYEALWIKVPIIVVVSKSNISAAIGGCGAAEDSCSKQ